MPDSRYGRRRLGVGARGAALDAVQLAQDLLRLAGDGPGVGRRLLLGDVAREGTRVDVVGLKTVA